MRKDRYLSFYVRVALLAVAILTNGLMFAPADASAFTFWRCRICVGSGGSLYNCCETQVCEEDDMCCDYDENCQGMN